MFEQLKKAFSNATKGISLREITPKDLNKNLFDLQLALYESDVGQEVIDDITVKLKEGLIGLKLEKDQSIEDTIRLKIRAMIAEMFDKSGNIDLIQKIKSKTQSKSGPFVIVFLGINGTGKTTTVAKIGQLLRKNGISVVLAAGDTHRSGAIEQLSQHAEKLSLKVIAQRYGADPSAVARDAIEYAKKHYIDAVLVDTAGRMQTAKNLMDEISKIVKVAKPDMKLFVGDSLAGNDTINQAKEFFQYTNFDGAILTKTDADSKGGAAISIVYMTSKPIVYLGIGQGYDDVLSFEYNRFLDSVFDDAPLIEGRNLPSGQDASQIINDPAFSADSVDPAIQGNAAKLTEAKTPYIKNENKHDQRPLSSSSTSGEKISKLPPITELNAATLSPKKTSLISTKQTAESKTKSLYDGAIESTTLNSSGSVKNKNNNSLAQEKKKSRFRGLFDRNKKDIEKDHNSKETQYVVEEERQSDELSSKNNSMKSKNGIHKKEGHKQNQDDEKVYLSDEDIEDLLK
jgi:fused signal recognition particle receptor